MRLDVALCVACLLCFLNVAASSAEKDAPRPNVIILLADDMGFSDLGCYGGEIETPNLDKLAHNGLRFTQFYNTARCWPTRSSILSGYYAQQVRMDPYKPGDRLPQWTRLLPQYLKPAGYRCYHSGKWHVFGAPLVLADAGFDQSYKLVDQDRFFSPKEHYENDQPLPQPRPDSGYYAPINIVDHAIKCLSEHAAQHKDTPFFHYIAFTSPHFPLQALQEDIDRCRDRYTGGWDKLREQRYKKLTKLGILDCALPARDPEFMPRYFNDSVLTTLGPGEVKHSVAWTDLSAEQQHFQAVKMAIHAAMIERMDREIGRLIKHLKKIGALDNTLIFFLSDNGADATVMVRGDNHDQTAPLGSHATFLCLGPGWATASNTPLRWHKVWVHEGGCATPLIAHWPKGIAARNELRHATGHVIDFAPTILDLAGVTPEPDWKGERAPVLPGKSLRPLFAADAPLERDFLFFNHEGNRALRRGDWKLVSAREKKNAWELYNISVDRSELHDLAEREPARVKAMSARWEELEAQFRRDGGTPLSGK